MFEAAPEVTPELETLAPPEPAQEAWAEPEAPMLAAEPVEAGPAAWPDLAAQPEAEPAAEPEVPQPARSAKGRKAADSASKNYDA